MRCAEGSMAINRQFCFSLEFKTGRNNNNCVLDVPGTGE